VDEKFLQQMDHQLTGWDDPVGRLHAALEKNELELYCQPIRARAAGAAPFPMAEVLVRLREEENALLPPGEFLPVFEHYRMMPQLDRWVVRTVAQRLALGSKVPRFTINVSGQTLEDLDFPLYVRDQVRETRIPASGLMFEIDEPDALARAGPAERFATDMKAVGCGLLIDGFGRRAVSFAPLKVLKLDFIKVDGSITRRILKSESAVQKLNAILRVSKAIGIGLISECVEEQDILVRLKALGVSHVQGFGVYRPHPIDSIAAGPAASAG
jgi:EAL domain-containing protein (putative c-di-GMP-specific phosphodiesterase class I)